MIRRLVFRVEWIILSNVPVFDSHQALVAVLGVLLIELVKNSLVDCDLVFTLSSNDLRGADLDVNFGAYWAKIGIELFLTTQWVVRIEYIKWF